MTRRVANGRAERSASGVAACRRPGVDAARYGRAPAGGEFDSSRVGVTFA